VKSLPIAIIALSLLLLLPSALARANHTAEVTSLPTTVQVQREVIEFHGPVTLKTMNGLTPIPSEHFRQDQKLVNKRAPRFLPLPEGSPDAFQTNWTQRRVETKISVPFDNGITRNPRAPGTFTFFRNSSLDSFISGFDRNVINEPAATNRGSVIFQVGNDYAALSADGGNSFAFIDPSSAFPPATGGFCCDQVVAYDPSRDLTFWVLQYDPNATQNTLRLAVSRGNDLAAGIWYYYDFLSSSGTSYDFADLCVSNNFLWMTNLGVSLSTGIVNNAFMRRIPLDELKAGINLNVDRFDSISNGLSNLSFRCTRGATNSMHWGDHNTTSQLRVFRWAENASVPTWNDVNLAFGWYDSPRVCPGPDGRDWCDRASRRILGAWNSKGIIGLMWSSSQGGPYPYPYVEVARIRESTLTLQDQPSILNYGWAYVFPAVSPNARGDLGVSLFAGGGGASGLFPTGAVGIDDDFNGDPLTSGWELVVAATSTQGPNQNLWGDYVSVASFVPTGLVWTATSYNLQGCGANWGCANPHFIIFGRERDAQSVSCYLPPGGCVYLPLILK
jgi:hypothetical protein